MKTEYNAKNTLGQIVTNDHRAASIFKDTSLDFCCGGKKTLEDACHEKGISTEAVLGQLNALNQAPVVSGQNFKEWDPGFLGDYIVNTHHKYVQKSLPDLIYYTQKIASVHGSNHPELLEIAELIQQVNAELLQHLQKEEEVLFPAIKEAIGLSSKNDQSNFEALKTTRSTISSEISRMNEEHEFVGGALDHISGITHHYKVPADGCQTYEVTFTLLEEFEDDLHIHIHLENNILFPKSLKL